MDIYTDNIGAMPIGRYEDISPIPLATLVSHVSHSEGLLDLSDGEVSISIIEPLSLFRDWDTVNDNRFIETMQRNTTEMIEDIQVEFVPIGNANDDPYRMPDDPENSFDSDRMVKIIFRITDLDIDSTMSDAEDRINEILDIWDNEAFVLIDGSISETQFH